MVFGADCIRGLIGIGADTEYFRVRDTFIISGRCITKEQRAAFISYKIPSYDDLKSIYYAQVKTNANFNKIAPYPDDNPGLGQFQSALQSGHKDAVFSVAQNLTINNTFLPNSDKTAVIFIGQNLNISTNITHSDSSSGIVFIVSKDVNIEPSVTQIDAVIIASGVIYTAGANCRLNPTIKNDVQLIVNGSLISLTESKPIKFCRNLPTNITAAEKINQQPKYVAILKDIFSDSLQKWSEIARPLP